MFNYSKAVIGMILLATTILPVVTISSPARAIPRNSTSNLIAKKSGVLEIDQVKFPVEIDLRNAQIRGGIPRQLFERDLITAINQFDGYRIRDTRYNKETLLNIDLVSIDNGGLTFNFTVNKKKYTCVRLFGRYRCTRAFSVTLNGLMKTGVRLRENKLIVDYRSHTVRGRGWYTDIASILDRIFKKQTVAAVKEGLRDLESKNLIELLKKGGIDKELPLNLTMDKLVELGISVNGDINPKGLEFVIQLPDKISIY